ncbi:carbohydrate ABC transporter permease [Prosthecomicrobium sp. N25]|uniref:carbohydrate ABC transporter permease n=1 Tax=Prosthecomicrobium sp. N25 TaxID=3129254 RepID=UPI00307855B5
MTTGAGRRGVRSRWIAQAAILPGMLLLFGGLVGSAAYSLVISFTDTGLMPSFTFVGLEQYRELFGNTRWLRATGNVAAYGIISVVATTALGTSLAVALDRGVRHEGIVRALVLYPFATSFIVTGVVWRWALDPTFGIDSLLRSAGLPATGIRWLSDPHTVIYALALAGVWHSAGVVMLIVLAGLRSIDPDIWRAARVDGIPSWRVYVSIVFPSLGPFWVTSMMILSVGVVKLHDLVVSMTNGGPGFASDVPARFIMDYLFERQSAGLASAGVVVMLSTVAIVVSPLLFMRSLKSAGRRRFGR